MKIKSFINRAVTEIKSEAKNLYENTIPYACQRNVPEPKLKQITNQINLLMAKKNVLEIIDLPLGRRADDVLLNAKIKERIGEYNAFAAKQEAAQRVFDEINK